MLPTHTILYPTDLDESSPHLFAFACALARDHGARLIVLHVELPPLGTAVVVERRDPQAYYAGVWQALREIRAPNILVEHQLAVGYAATEILRVARESKAGLIVMGTHGRRGLGRLLMGSTAEAVLRQAACPVLTVKLPAADVPLSPKSPKADRQARSAATLPVRTILHPTDFSTPAKNAFDRACALARDYGARLVVVHVKPIAPIVGSEFGTVFPPEPAGVSEGLRNQLASVRPEDAAIPVEHHLLEGDAGGQILRLAGECRCDLIVMGTHGRTGLGRLLLGSVAEAVVRKAPCPVLTIKTPTAGVPAPPASQGPEGARVLHMIANDEILF